MQSNISVVLNLYKRPQILEEQLRAIQNQSLKPKEILLYQDGVFEGIEIPKHIKNDFDFIEISKDNKGVWARFDFARRIAKFDLVCIFDDDTIPEVDYLANCFLQMQEEEGLYGTNGVVLSDPHKYPFDKFFNIGWVNPNETRTQVDFVGHSWFFKKEWLDDLLSIKELQKFKIAGEDIAFSLALQRKNIKTFTPPPSH